jgi:hypothetical protein
MIPNHSRLGATLFINRTLFAASLEMSSGVAADGTTFPRVSSRSRGNDMSLSSRLDKLYDPQSSHSVNVPPQLFPTSTNAASVDHVH